MIYFLALFLGAVTSEVSNPTLLLDFIALGFLDVSSAL
jgi:hypothetical protein